MDESTMKGCWTCPLISGAHKAAVLTISRSFLRVAHEPPPPVSCSPIEGTPNRAIDPVYDAVIDDQESVIFFFFLHKRISIKSASLIVQLATQLISEI